MRMRETYDPCMTHVAFCIKPGFAIALTALMITERS
jgi:hypothetical protein